MLRIAICDDEASARISLNEYVQKLLLKIGSQAEVTLFDSGQHLLDAYPKNLDVLLLDIQMGTPDGVETAKAIRKFDKSVIILFITCMPQYAIECYKVRAFGYLLKPLTYSAFEIEMKEVFPRLVSDGSSYLTLKNDDGISKVEIKDISYVEVYNRKLLIHTRHGDFSQRGTLSDIEERLAPFRFLRCHSAILVNCDQIVKIEAAQFRLTDGSEIPISKNRRAACLQKFGKYLEGKV